MTASTWAARVRARRHARLVRSSRAATAHRPLWMPLLVATVRGRFRRVSEASSPWKSGLTFHSYLWMFRRAPERLAAVRDGLSRGGTCDSEYVGGSGSGSTPCPAGQVFTSSNGASTTVDDATCCKSPPRLRWASEARSRVLCARRCGFSVALIESTMFRGDLAARDRRAGRQMEF